MTVDLEDGASSSESLSYLRNIPQAIQDSLKFTCASCTHCPSSPWPPFHANVAPGIILSLNNYIIYYVEYRPLTILYSPWPWIQNGREGYVAIGMQFDFLSILPCLICAQSVAEVNAAQEFVCYHTRVNFREDVLGVGLQVKLLKYTLTSSTPRTLLIFYSEVDISSPSPQLPWICYRVVRSKRVCAPPWWGKNLRIGFRFVSNMSSFFVDINCFYRYMRRPW